MTDDCCELAVDLPKQGRIILKRQNERLRVDLLPRRLTSGEIAV